METGKVTRLGLGAGMEMRIETGRGVRMGKGIEQERGLDREKRKVLGMGKEIATEMISGMGAGIGTGIGTREEGEIRTRMGTIMEIRKGKRIRSATVSRMRTGIRTGKGIGTGTGMEIGMLIFFKKSRITIDKHENNSKKRKKWDLIKV